MNLKRSLAALAVGASLVVAACGDDSETTSNSTITVTAPQTSTTSSTSTESTSTESTTTESTTTTSTTSTTTREADDDTGGVSPDDSGEDSFDDFCDENPEACE